jgi:uncharacterized membrane protein YgcG
MNFFNFLLTRQLVLDKTGDADRANKLGMLTSLVPGPWGMLMGVVLADREEAAKRDDRQTPGGGSTGGGSTGPQGGSGASSSGGGSGAIERVVGGTSTQAFAAEVQQSPARRS